MKVFLSSTVKGLRDVRLFLDQNLESICHNNVELVCYERCAHANPHLVAEDICLSLVRECKAFIIIIDQFYGTAFKKNPNISITHAELHEALNHGLNIIPLVRYQTWCEYQVHNRNPTQEIRYAYVVEPKVFDMLDEVSSFHCHIYDSFTDKDALSKIAGTLDAIITKGAVGTIQHITLPSSSSLIETPAPIKTKPPEAEPPAPEEPEPTTPENRPPKEPAQAKAKPPASVLNLPYFSNGSRLTAEHMSNLFQSVFEAANRAGLSIGQPKKWKDGDRFSADDMNGLVRNIEQIYIHKKQTRPKWSFGIFKKGSAFKASYMNEVVDSVKALFSND